MKKLIDLFNKKYGSVYGVIDDSFSNEDTYKIYKIIKTLCSDDKEIMTVLEKVKLPEPKTAKESIEKININVSGGVGNDDVPHYNETLIFEISGEDYGSFSNNSYFNIDILNLDETKSYVGKEMNSDEKHTYEFVYDKEADALMDEDNLIYIYNHKSFNGTDFIEDENSAVLTFNMKPMYVSEVNGYFRLYEIDKVELDNNCLSSDLTIKNSLTVGNRIGDIGEYSVSEGYQNTASSYCSHSEGDGTTASGYASHAEGQYSKAEGAVSHAEGWYTTASGSSSHAEGSETTASGTGSHAEGNCTEASRNYSHAEGNGTTASGEGSHVEGSSTIASGNYSHAEGNGTTASSYYSHAEGNGTTASGEGSHAEGMETKAIGHRSHAEGYRSTALGECSHAEGFSNNMANKQIANLSTTTSNTTITNTWKRIKFSLAKSNYSHVEGNNCLALDECSHAEGNNTIASNSYCHSEGNSTKATGNTSHAEGGSTTASGDYSHAEGDSTEASGEASHAEGSGAIASGDYSHAENYASAEGNNSHAEGYWTYASSANQHVQGKFNIKDTTGTYAHIVGNGSSDTARSNAHTLDWEGNGWYAGKLTQEGVPTEDKDLATKKYVDDKTASIDTTINNTLPSNGLLTLTTDKIQTTTLAVPTDITLPTVTGYTEIHLLFEGSEGVTITTGVTTVRWQSVLTIEQGKVYEVIFTYVNDTIGWLASYIIYN